MPKGDVPRNTTTRVMATQKRLSDVLKAKQRPMPKKPRPSAKEVDEAFRAYSDASKYPSLFQSRKDADPSKQWYGKRKNAKWYNEFREGLKDMADGEYSKGRRSARSIRSDESVGGTLARTKENPVKALKRRASNKKV